MKDFSFIINDVANLLEALGIDPVNVEQHGTSIVVQCSCLPAALSLIDELKIIGLYGERLSLFRVDAPRVEIRRAFDVDAHDQANIPEGVTTELVAAAMVRFGNRFIHNLGQLIYSADEGQVKRIRKAFPEEWKAWGQRAEDESL